jgi:hypothetical protein
VPAVAVWCAVECVNELDVPVLVNTDQPRASRPDEDAAEWVGASVGKADRLEVLGASEVVQGGDSLPAVALGPPDLAPVHDRPKALPILRSQRPDMPSIQIAQSAPPIEIENRNAARR